MAKGELLSLCRRTAHYELSRLFISGVWFILKRTIDRFAFINIIVNKNKPYSHDPQRRNKFDTNQNLQRHILNV